MIFRQLRDKPWETVPGQIDDRFDGGMAALPAATLGLRMFLAVITVMFLMLIIAYGGRMAFEDWRPGPNSNLLWLNTAMLILSSISMQWATMSARRGQLGGVKNGLRAGGVFAFAFLAGQIVAWRQLGTMENIGISNPAIGFFYMITALHALHLVGGIVAWGRTTLKIQGENDVAKISLSVKLCTIYWHYLLLVWLILFGLLFSGNDKLSWGLSVIH